MTEACDYIRSSLSKRLEEYEDTAFRAGQRAAGMTQDEARDLQKQDEDKQQRMFTRITGMIEQLALCEVRTVVQGAMDGEEENGGEGTRKFLVVTPDCKPCADLKARVKEPAIEIVDATTDEGEDFLERCMDEGIVFTDAPQAIVEQDGKLLILLGTEYPGFLGESKPKEAIGKKSGLAPGSFGGYSK